MTPRAYYNEWDPGAAAWLRELIRGGHIMDGDVDERSISDVEASDLRGYTRCHFFAGIGGWDLALRLAGWPDARPVWTGSPPCQSFSAAGQRKGAADDRNLWPEFVRLVREHRPATLFGEQVAAAVGYGWFDAVLADLEACGYACAAAVLPACSVGAPHRRERLWFVVNSDRRGREIQWKQEHGAVKRQPGAQPDRSSSRGWRHGAGWHQCADGKSRPVEPGSSPLAHGIPARVVRLRGYGNAIVPQVAAEVIGAFLDITPAD